VLGSGLRHLDRSGQPAEWVLPQARETTGRSRILIEGEGGVSFRPDPEAVRRAIEQADELADCLARAYELGIHEDSDAVATVIEVWSKESVE
jgi:hypothetical protein